MVVPKIAMLPTAYATSKLFSQLPTDGDGDFTMARADAANGSATRVNSSNLIEALDANVPRLDYSDGGCPVLLVEPASENLFTYSEEFDNAAWSKANTGSGVAPVVTANQAVAPDGTLTADRVQFDAGGSTSSDRSILRQLETTSATDYTESFYIKSNTGAGDQTLAFSFDGSTRDTFTVSEGDWVRVSYTATSVGTTSFIGIELKGDVTNQTADILIWGGQLEQLTYATSYIPTSGATVIRAAETYIDSGNSTDIDSTNGVLYIETAALFNDGNNRAISLSDGTVNNRVSILYSSTDNTLSFQVLVGAAGQVSENATLIDATLYSRIAFKYSLNDFEIYLNGLKVGEDTSGSVFPASTLDRLVLDGGAGSDNFYGKVKKIYYYNQDLTQLQIESQTGFSTFSEMANQLEYTIE